MLALLWSTFCPLSVPLSNPLLCFGQSGKVSVEYGLVREGYANDRYSGCRDDEGNVSWHIAALVQT